MGYTNFPRFAPAFAVFLLVSCSDEGIAPLNDDSTAKVEQLSVQVEKRYPFDDTSFTQGLEVAPDGTLLIGTGQEGESRLYRSTLAGQELSSLDLDPEFFGEGITQFDDFIWQLTWQDNVAVKRDAESLVELERAKFDGEGWGLCSMENHIVFSDGTSELRRMDPDTLQEQERFTVTLEGEAVTGLNELECVDDEVYANVFTTTDILRIDADSGEVTGVIDASGLENNATPDPNNVLNGIAHVPGSDKFLLSGKRWPDLYEVTFVPAD
ncbi:glutaminyl-peptide cyclotransferase [Corynebacterium breve]|uniref:Glutaminyl-peptide cyclotransferase n=1 Tax=Corynebacterium breve TaxID=3049799 RepID=A0ABY8VGB3_9CORY|nr:glutaminyl-peptide cyclotransferase [Corynebacterium breve]WIM68352.1 glutaminyl-peptide cyclotransferase [Corynebacterium breve]